MEDCEDPAVDSLGLFLLRFRNVFLLLFKRRDIFGIIETRDEVDRRAYE